MISTEKALRVRGVPLALFVSLRSLGGAVSGPVAGRQPAGTAHCSDRCPAKPFHPPMDRQKPALHPHLHGCVCHGSIRLSLRARQAAGRGGARLRHMGQPPAGQRHVRPEGEHSADQARLSGAGHPQAPPEPERAGHRRLRCRQDPRICEAQHSAGQQQLCYHRPQVGSTPLHRRLPEKQGL